MCNKIVIAGGTGFIGNYLATRFRNVGCEVILISRAKGNINWENTLEVSNALENADLLINLAGKSVDCRYSEKTKGKYYFREHRPQGCSVRQF